MLFGPRTALQGGWLPPGLLHGQAGPTTGGEGGGAALRPDHTIPCHPIARGGVGAGGDTYIYIYIHVRVYVHLAPPCPSPQGGDRRAKRTPIGHVTRSSVTRSSVPRYPLRGVTHNAERWNAALSVMPAIWNASYKERSRENAPWTFHDERFGGNAL